MEMFRTARTILLLSSAVAILALAAAACGGGDDDNSEDGSSGNAEATATPAPDGQTEPTEEPSEEPTEEGNADPDSDGDEEDDGAGLDRLRAAASTIEEQTFHAVFEMSGTGIEGTFTIISDPPDSLIGISGALDGEEGTLLLISTEEFSYFCSDSDGEQNCLKMKAGSTSGVPLPTLLDAGSLVDELASSPDTKVKRIGGETIAGIDTDCYEVTSAEGDGKICIGNDMMLLLEGNFEGQQLSMRATEFTDDAGKVKVTVPDWPVTDLTSLGN
jgi:hypothetical protein